MKKILCVICNYHPLIGGAEKQAFIINQRYINHNYKVHILTIRNSFLDSYTDNIDNQIIYRLGLPIKGIKTFTAVFHAIKLYFFEKKYVLVHLHQGTVFSILVGNLFKNKKNNLICKIGNSDTKFDLNFKNNKIKRILLKYFVHKVDYFISINQLIKNQLISFGISKNKILSIPNMINCLNLPRDKVYFSKNSLRFLTISRLVPQKNILFILNIAKKFPEHKFYIKGYGELRDKIHKNIIDNNIKNVFILDKNIEINFNEFDFYLSVSFVEGMSNSILEALSNGLPLFVNDIPGNLIFKELNDTNSIGFFPNLNNFIEEIKSLQNLDEKSYLDMRLNCLDVIKKNFDIDILINKYLDLINEKDNNFNT